MSWALADASFAHTREFETQRIGIGDQPGRVHGLAAATRGDTSKRASSSKPFVQRCESTSEICGRRAARHRRRSADPKRQPSRGHRREPARRRLPSPGTVPSFPGKRTRCCPKQCPSCAHGGCRAWANEPTEPRGVSTAARCSWGRGATDRGRSRGREARARRDRAAVPAPQWRPSGRRRR